MPGQLRNVVLGAVAATVIAGCGSDDGTIPPDDAETLLTRLEVIDENVSQGDCPGARAQAETFASDVEELPGSVEDDVRRGLEQSASQLVSLTSSDCEPQTGTTDIGGAVPPDTTVTETAETTEPETTETTTEEPETPDEQTTEEPQTAEPQEDEQIEPPTDNPGQGGGVGSDGGIGPGSNRGRSG